MGSTSVKYGSLFQRLALFNIEPHHDFKLLPFDFFCPSLTGVLHKRTCSMCGKYFASQTAVNSHMKACHLGSNRVTIDEEDLIADDDENHNPVEVSDNINESSGADVVIVRNLFEWLQSEFTTETD